MPSEGSVHTLKFDTTDSSRPTAIALRLRERWLRLAQAPSSSPKFESDALLPYEYRGALRRPERPSPGLLLRHVNRCQMTCQSLPNDKSAPRCRRTRQKWPIWPCPAAAPEHNGVGRSAGVEGGTPRLLLPSSESHPPQTPTLPTGV